jgi:hypothetical protein
VAKDLASAIVDLGVSAEKRRQGRRALRQSVELVVVEILRHARVGDTAMIRVGADNENAPTSDLRRNLRGVYRTYKVERVDWLVELPPPYDEEPPASADEREPTLVQYTVQLDPDQDLSAGIFAPNEKYYGAVLLDVRHDVRMWVEARNGVGSAKVSGRDVLLVPPAHEVEPYQAELHLATDDELVTFANEALDVVEQFVKSFHAANHIYTTAAENLTKLAPK